MKKLLLASITLGLSFFAPLAKAQVPPPPKACNEVAYPEFHSLRPYQASPCFSSISDTADLCGDSLTLTDNVTVTYSPKEDTCVTIAGGKVRCTYTKAMNKSISIDLKGATLPIMGNTEEVINSTNKIDSTLPNDNSNNMPPEQRVNDYVSWYLNGIFNRAEYSPIFYNDSKAPSVPDFSGPINKLLPQETAYRARTETIISATRGKDATQHDQVVGCTLGYKVPVLGTEVGGYPIPCHIKAPNAVSQALLDSYIQHWRLSDWKNYNRLPPLRSDYSSYSDYYVAYRAWRGDKCIPVPIPDKFLGFPIPIIGGTTMFLCGDDPLKPNFWSNLYNYIPLSSTEDRVGEASISTSVSSTADVTISNFIYTPVAGSSKLYFSHLEESRDLATTLQSTYLYNSNEDVGALPGNSVPVQTAGACKIVDVRTNKGDNLFANPISGTISYDASFTCDFIPPADSCRNGDCLHDCTVCDGRAASECGSVCSSATPTPNACYNNNCLHDCEICDGKSHDTCLAQCQTASIGRASGQVLGEIAALVCTCRWYSCQSGESPNGTCGSSGQINCCKQSATPTPIPNTCSGQCRTGNCNDYGMCGGSGSCGGGLFCCEACPPASPTPTPDSTCYNGDCLHDCVVCDGQTASYCGSKCSVSTPSPNPGCYTGVCMHDCTVCDSMPEVACGYRCNVTPTPAPVPTPQTCTKTIPITLAINTKTPLVDNIWTRLVSGSASVFRRIFPKLGNGSDIGEVKDIPGSTSVTYSGTTTGVGQLNFPHVGGISEYFLKGIQTMLRPKGYGEAISFGEPITPIGGDCGSAPVQIPTEGTITKELLAKDAPKGNRVLECYDYVVQKSKEAGITPAFTLLLWLNESGCSSNPALQDFGINSSSVSGLFAQLDYFLNLPGTGPNGYITRYSSCFGGGYNTRNFFGLYHGDGCAPKVPLAGQGYLDYLKLHWYGYTHCPAGPDGYPLYPFKSSCF